MANRFRPFGGILLVVAGMYALWVMTTLNSAAYMMASAFGGGVPFTVVWNIALAVALAIVGVVLLTADPPPRMFQQLNQKGLILFVILAAILPILCWLPWLIPTLKQRSAES